MSITGNYLDAPTALAWGLVNEVVPHEELLPRCRAIAADIVGNDQKGLRRILQTYDLGGGATEEHAWEIERSVSFQWFVAGVDPADVEARRTGVVERGRSQQGCTRMLVDQGSVGREVVDVRESARHAEQVGYSTFFYAETKHDPFLPLVLAAEHTERIRLGTGIALAFARSPMTLAASANDVQQFSEGRLLLGLGSQIKPHITRRFSMPWSRPAARMREFVLALHAIWDAWNNETKLDFRGEFYSHTLMTPFFAPDPNPYGAPKVMLAGVGERMNEVVGEVADGFLGHSLTTARYLDEVILPAIERGRAKSGRSADGFEASGQLIVITGRDEQEMAQVAETAGARSRSICRRRRTAACSRCSTGGAARTSSRACRSRASGTP